MKLKCAQQGSAPLTAHYLSKQILITVILANNIDLLELQGQLSTGWINYQDCTEKKLQEEALVSQDISQHGTAKLYK